MSPLLLEYPISVAILYYGGQAADLADTELAVKEISQALENRGHIVRTAGVSKSNWMKAVRTPGQVVFNLVEDETWELYTKVGLKLEQMGRAQMGHDMKSFLYATKKSRMKRRMQKMNISTPEFRIFNRRSRISQVRGLEFPLIVKPSGQHAGIGISQDSVVIDQDELEERLKYLFKNFAGEMIAEEFIDGREIHVTVMGNGRHIVTLPPCEVVFGGEFADNWEIYTYEAKWEKDTWEYWDARAHAPAKIGRRLEEKLARLAKRAYSAFGCRDIARCDIRVDKDEKAYVVDVNMNPSLTRDDQDATWLSVHSLGWSYEEFIETVVAIAYRRVYGRLPDRVQERQLLLAAQRT